MWGGVARSRNRIVGAADIPWVLGVRAGLVHAVRSRMRTGRPARVRGMRPLCRVFYFSNMCAKQFANLRVETRMLARRSLGLRQNAGTGASGKISEWKGPRHEGHPARTAGAAPRGGAAWRRAEADRQPARQGQADRARADRAAAARRRQFRRIRHVRHPSLHRFRDGEIQAPRRWRGDRLGHGQRPHGLRVQPGFHRARRLGVGRPTPPRSARSWTWRCRTARR
jgi:hypothetical protein